MNHTYRLVWNQLTSHFAAASEKAGRGRPGRTAQKLPVGVLSVALGAAGTLSSMASHAGPTGGQVTSGSAHITQSGTTTTVQQNTQTLSLNWQSFDVNANESVNFQQPNAGALAVNRISGNSASQIFGHLNANGQVWLINPNGVLFGKGSQLDVAGLVASTLDTGGINQGTASFSGAGMGSIVNQGTINAAPGGYVALLGNAVSNQGVISARLGTVALGAGAAATLTFAGNQLLQLQIDRSTLNNVAQNQGLLAADGGTVYMTAGARNSLLASTVNTTGLIRASTVEDHNGTIVLTAGEAAGSVTIAGTVATSDAIGTGGTVTATARQVSVTGGAQINASGSAGGGAIRIGGGWEGGEDVAQATTVSVADTAILNASATTQGNGGEIVVRSDVGSAHSTTSVHGVLIALGADDGDGGRVETSGHVLNTSGGTVQTSSGTGKAGEWLLDPYNVTITSGATSGTAFSSTYSPTQNSSIAASSINSALQSGTSVMITTGSSGGSNGDITVNAPITKASGNSDVTLTLKAADTIGINAPITNSGGSGKLNVTLLADSDHNGAGVTILTSNIITGGGALTFGDGSTATVNGVANTLVGGDVYVGSNSPVNLTTAGGAVSINGQLIIAIANSGALTIDTTNSSAATAGPVSFAGTIDSGDTYALINSAMGWNSALTAAKSGSGGNVGDTYLATLTTRLENAVVSFDVGYTASWLGAQRVFGLGTDAQWRWVGGPEGLQDSGHGLAFFTQNPGNTTPAGQPNGSAIAGAYINWNPTTPEPNNYNGTGLSQANSQEWVLQFVGTQGQWNDLNPTSNSLPYVKETNLANSSLTVNAGSVQNVTFNGAIGQSKPLNNLTVTGNIVGLTSTGPSPSTNIATSGAIDFNGQVQVDGSNKDLVVITAPSITTTYGATLPTLTPTYGGFLNGDTAAVLTTQPTVATTGSTSHVSSAPITASGAADSNDTNYFFIYNPGVLLVNPALLTVTATSVASKVYNGLTGATVSGGTLSGIVGSDDVTLATQTGTFASASAGTGIAVTVADTLGGTAAGNYTLVQPTATGNITPAPLTVTGTETAASRIYNGTTAATISGATLSGVIAADIGNVAVQGSFAQANAGLGISIIDSLTGTAAGNYSISNPPAVTANINPKPLTISGTESASSKVYDGTTAAALSGGTLTGVIAADSGNVGLQGVFAQPNVASNIAVTATLNGTAAGNYSLTSPTLAANITPATITLSGTATASSKTYDGTTAATVSGAILTGVVPADSGAISLGGTFATPNAGSNIAVTALLAGTAAGNYQLSGTPALAASINPATVTITGNETASSRTYDGTTAASITGGILIGILTADASHVGVQGAFVQANAGRNISVIDSLTGTAASNYVLAGQPFVAANINPAPVMVSGAETASSKSYDGTTAATIVGGTLSGLIPADAGSVALAGNFVTANAGQSIPIVTFLTGAASGNYAVVSAPAVSANINPAALTATAAPSLLNVGGATPALTGTLTGFVSGQTLQALQASGYQLTWTSTGGSQSTAGQYAIVGAFNDPNYQVQQAAGNATALTAAVVSAASTTSSGSIISTQTVPTAGAAASNAGALGASSVGVTTLTASTSAPIFAGSGSDNGDGGSDTTNNSAGGNVDARLSNAGSSGFSAYLMRTAQLGNADVSGTAATNAAATSAAASADNAAAMTSDTATAATPAGDERTKHGQKKARSSDPGGRLLYVVNGGLNTTGYGVSSSTVGGDR